MHTLPRSLPLLYFRTTADPSAAFLQSSTISTWLAALCVGAVGCTDDARGAWSTAAMTLQIKQPKLSRPSQNMKGDFVQSAFCVLQRNGT